MTHPVDWDLAERVGVRIAARRYTPPAGLPTDAMLAPLAERAEAMVEASTGLRAPSPARVHVVDRAAWVRANLASVQTLLGPTLDRIGERMGAKHRALPLRVTSKAAAVELGTMLGWMSTRVLGQYDLLVAAEPADSAADGIPEAVYLVGPNVAALEQRFGFPSEQFRLWVTLHELTHRAQFRGVPWMRGHYLSLVHEALTLADPDPARMMAALKDAARDREGAKRTIAEGGAVALIATPQQRVTLNRIAGLMSLLEGHGDVTMDRAAGDAIPSADRFARVLRERRRSANGLTKLFQRLIGLEAKLNQYEAGERFCHAVEAAGDGMLERCWRSPEDLPSLDEIRDPAGWVARVAPRALT